MPSPREMLTQPAAACGRDDPPLASSSEPASSCTAPLGEPSSFEEAFGAAISRRLQPWNATWMGMQHINQQLLMAAEWCRVQLCVVHGRLYLRGWWRSRAAASPLMRENLGGFRHHTAILGLAETLKRHAVEDVCITINCQDRPSVWKYMSVPRPGRSAGAPPMIVPVRWGRLGAPLLLSYMSSKDHLDVPWPDYLFWGRTSKLVAPWEVVLRGITDESARVPYRARLRRAVYSASVPQSNKSFEARMKPLRQEFVRRCLSRCDGGLAPLVDMEKPWDEAMARLIREGLKNGTGSLQFNKNCHYRSIVQLQGRSAWLDHWKMDLACGSPVVFLGDRAMPESDGFAYSSPAKSFFSHLLQPGQHYIHIDADHQHPDERMLVKIGSNTTLIGHGLCHTVELTHRWLLANEGNASCIGQSGQRVVRRWLRMQRVYQYMAAVLRKIAAIQAYARIHIYVPSSVWFVRLNVSDCLERDDDRVACVGARVQAALAAGTPAAAKAANAPVKPVDWWLG
ncbi:hypothetical protein AB1Y20_013279 [Prymnesium parvum]|uniref:Glycosyl transferase CAP10 domain-containing protein n=1 Tax=Prymnesium parvum TaxID=97485 RepID=A0AB34IN36_PRYPA